jgi:predicted transcriptional regulator
VISVETTLQILAGVPTRHARYLLEQAVFHPRRWKDVAKAAVAELERRAMVALLREAREWLDTADPETCSWCDTDDIVTRIDALLLEVEAK